MERIDFQVNEEDRKDIIKRTCKFALRILYIVNKPCCCIKFGAWIYPTLTQRGMAVKSMLSLGSIQE